MKKRPKKPAAPTALVPAPAARPVRIARPEPAEPTALTIAAPIRVHVKGKTPGARINAWHMLAIDAGKTSIAAGIMAGWELARARQACDHGQWLAWLKKNTFLSDETARRYLTVFAQTVGAARAALPKPVPLEVQPTLAELKSACADVDGKSLTALYGQLRLLKRSGKWGGAREGAGRPKNGGGDAEAEAAELDAIANNPALLYAALRSPLDELWRLHRERSVFDRLGSSELAAVQPVLRDLADAATAALETRHGLR